MNITGIVVEYNPFHNGHIYHINKSKELTNSDLLVAITSGNFTQRGEVSIIDKFKKTQAALEHGVDLIVELPYIYTIQSATVFGSKSIDILNKLRVNNVVFGSETNNLEELQSFAKHNINMDHLKEEMDKGNSFPKAYGLLAGSLYPNDILAVTYLREINKTNIKPFTIQRTNNYNSEDLCEIASAKAIRMAIKENKEYGLATPISIDEPIFNESIYPFLQQRLLTSSKEELRDIFLVSEGIENLLINNAYKCDSYDEFINESISKRYTKARINRICLNILNNIKTCEVNALEEVNYIRVLGFNAKGQEYLKTFRDDENLRIVTQFKNIPNNYKDIEWKVSNTYACLLNDRKAYLKKELQGPIIKEQI